MTDYVEHHEPFQYYASTANPDHVAPSSVSQVGLSDPSGTPANEAVNHQYDISLFSQALQQGDLPQVSYLKPPAYENGHAGNSDPLDEQRFLVDTIDEIEQSSYWPNTAIVIAYDDSDGWYDHQIGPIVRPPQDTIDSLNGPGQVRYVREPARPERPLRRRSAHAADGDLAMGTPELRRRHVHRAGLDHAVHRGQLEPRARRRRVG